MNIKLIFFLLYILLGTSGTTIPWLITGFDPFNISIGLMTLISSTIGYNSSEKIMSMCSQESSSSNNKVAYNIFAIILSLLLTIVGSIMLLKKHENIALTISVVAYIISCWNWWHQNKDNKNFDEAGRPDGP